MTEKLIYLVHATSGLYLGGPRGKLKPGADGFEQGLLELYDQTDLDHLNAAERTRVQWYTDQVAEPTGLPCTSIF